jgi:hypothetical protein
MKKIILSVTFVAAMGLFAGVNAQDTKTGKKGGAKTEQCCKKDAKPGDKKPCGKSVEAKSCDNKKTEGGCCEVKKAGKKARDKK